MSGTDPLTCELDPRDDVLLARIVGHADLTQLPRLQKFLADVEAKKAPLVVLDLSGLQFMSSVGLGALVWLRRSCEARRATLRLACLSPTMLQLFKASALDKGFNLYPTLEKATGL